MLDAPGAWDFNLGLGKRQRRTSSTVYVLPAYTVSSLERANAFLASGMLRALTLHSYSNSRSCCTTLGGIYLARYKCLSYSHLHLPNRLSINGEDKNTSDTRVIETVLTIYFKIIPVRVLIAPH